MPGVIDTDIVDGWALTAKLDNGVHQIELRKDGCLVIIAGPTGYNHSFYKAEPDRWGRSTAGTNIHISMNGPQQWTWDDFVAFEKAVKVARLHVGT